MCANVQSMLPVQQCVSERGKRVRVGEIAFDGE